ncbi:MAG: DUF342 domain-containing protein [Pseudobutyrivibrio sp.]|nr:DUF342 domain-containing protein [Pseudobutyrivibrio sp.]
MADERNVKISVSSDGLSATLVLAVPEAGTGEPVYSRDIFVNILKDHDVVYGVDLAALTELAESPAYEREIIVARGLPPEESIPGYFEYHFETNLTKKPTIREDGSVDYMNIKAFATVKAGDLIATYHPAIKGTGGMSVRGTIIEPKPVRDLPTLGGRGFDKSEDGISYTSLIDGKIELSGSRVIISPVYEVDKDADLSTGNIIFNGDVIVHGGIKDFVTLKASGNITINGLVENCTISAGKDLFLLSGVKGGEYTTIECGGDLVAQFVESAEIKVGGDMTCTYLFKTKTTVDGRLEINGDKCSIIGGEVSAVQGLEVDNIGNNFGVITDVGVGVTAERLRAIQQLEHKILGMRENLAKVKKGLEDFDKASQEKGLNNREDPRRMELLRMKIKFEASITAEEATLAKMKTIIAKGERATIRAFKTVYAGVNIAIGSHRTIITDDQQYIEFVKSPSGIRMERMEGIIEKVAK